jgi:hypothetical protein
LSELVDVVGPVRNQAAVSDELCRAASVMIKRR